MTVGRPIKSARVRSIPSWLSAVNSGAGIASVTRVPFNSLCSMVVSSSRTTVASGFGCLAVEQASMLISNHIFSIVIYNVA